MSASDQDDYRDRLKASLLRTAEATIAEHGLKAIQARPIAQSAGCSVGTLYNIYGDIDGLILAANERTLAELGRVLTVAAQRAGGQPLMSRLMALASTYLDFATVNQRRWRAIFEHRLPETRVPPPSYHQDRRRLLALIEQELESTIPDPAQRYTAAFAMFAAVHGIVLLSLDGKIAPFDPAECERRIRFIVENVLAGLARTG